MATCKHDWTPHTHPVTGHRMPFCLKCGAWDERGIEPGTGRDHDTGEFAPANERLAPSPAKSPTKE